MEVPKSNLIRKEQVIDMARAKKEGNFKFLNVQIPEDIIERLSEYSAQSRIPKNAVTEMALREYLDKVLPQKTKKKVGGK